MPRDFPPHHPSTHASGSRRFDPDAPDYDQRTGIPSTVTQQVAKAIVEAWRQHNPSLEAGETTDQSSRIQILELAAGTGELGQYLSQLGRYTALEGSRGMLEQAQQRHYAAHSQLHLWDVNQDWPLADDSQDIIFISRAAHLLDPAHLHKELVRCGRKNSLLILGRVEKDPNSPARRLRHLLHQLLRQQGLQPRRGDRTQQELPAQLDAQSWRIEAAHWMVQEQAAEALAAWRNKPGLAGLDIPAQQQADLLLQLEQQAVAELGDLYQIYHGTRRFLLQLARIHPARNTPPVEYSPA